MSKSALAELANVEFLRAAWRDFFRETPRSKRNSKGIDGISFLDFKAKENETLQEISDELLGKRIGGQRKTYSHSPLAVFPLEKPGKDRYRIICIPTIKDRLIQKSVLRFLFLRDFSFETKISYGYSRKKSVQNALRKAKELRSDKPWVYKTDIKSFFDEIQRGAMKQCVQRKIKLRSLHNIMFQAIDAEITQSADRATKEIVKKEGIREGTGLRQGLPLSPLLSNLYLESFDAELSGSSFNAIRYADDLAIFCKTRAECYEAHEFCVRELQKLDLRVQPIGHNKTSIYAPHDIAEFLGLGIAKVNDKYELRITDGQIDAVWKKYEAYGDIENDVKKEIMFANVYHRLESLENSYKGHYGEADNYLSFEANLSRWKRIVFRRIFEDGYGIDIDKLSGAKKKFLYIQE